MKTRNRNNSPSGLSKSIPAILAIVLITSFFSTGCYPATRSSELEKAMNDAFVSRAKSALRSIGSCQLEFQGSSPNGSYGTFEALQNSQYIAAGYTLDNMMEGHTMTWEVSSSTAVSVEEEEVVGFSDVIEMEEDDDDTVYDEFTIIAFPRDPKGLSTFCITEDQLLRVYNLDEGNDPDNVKTWEVVH